MKAKTVYYLKGDRNFPAHRVGSPKKDECNQTPWLFIDGKWKGDVVMVEPYKMERSNDRQRLQKPRSTGTDKRDIQRSLDGTGRG